MTGPSVRRTLIAGLFGLGLGLLLRLPGAEKVETTLLSIAVPFGKAFLRALFVLVLPLLFSSLTLGVSELGPRTLGRFGKRLLGYTIVLSSAAVVIGVALVNLVRPGDGLDRSMLPAFVPPPLPSPKPASEILVQMIPENIVRSAVEGDMLAVIVFSLAFGAALGACDPKTVLPLAGGLAAVQEVTMKLVEWVLLLLPLGVFSFLFQLGASLGLSLVVALGKYVAVVLVALLLQQFFVYSLAIRYLAKRSPLEFFRAVRPAMVVAFSTASSTATLPSALQVAEENLRLPRPVARFVLTAGSAMNQNGTALFEGVTVLFLAQAYGVPLAFGAQVQVVLIAVLGGIGTAGIPAGSLPVIAMILKMNGIPAEGLGLILGVDRLLDMCRTVLNVTGDLAAATYVAESAPEPLPG